MWNLIQFWVKRLITSPDAFWVLLNPVLQAFVLLSGPIDLFRIALTILLLLDLLLILRRVYREGNMVRATSDKHLIRSLRPKPAGNGREERALRRSNS